MFVRLPCGGVGVSRSEVGSFIVTGKKKCKGFGSEVTEWKDLVVCPEAKANMSRHHANRLRLK